MNKSLTTDFGGLGAREGLVESVRQCPAIVSCEPERPGEEVGATRQQTDFPFWTTKATILGMVTTREMTRTGPRQAWAYMLRDNGHAVTDQICLDSDHPDCPLLPLPD